MGSASHPKHRSRGVAAVALLLVAIVGASAPAVVEAITTTDALVEATHTTLPVTLGELDAETTPEHTPGSVDLSEAETKDPTQRLEIIKQIRKVNQDGSYTVGYEAEDGTFKIESRDVLGNIKGTYGYIDANGDIKRVSYGGQPTRGVPTLTTPPTPEEEIVHIPPRFNRTHPHLLVPTTRRPPNYQPPQHLHHNPQHASTLRPSVIQTIPRKRHGFSPSTMMPTTTSTSGSTAAMSGLSSTTSPTTTPTTTSTTSTTTERSMTTAATETGGHLAASFGEPTAASTHTSSHHTKPGTLLIIRPTPLPYQAGKTAEQLARPERLEAAKYTHAPAPSKKPIRGNFLRRQLAPAVSESGEQYEAQPQQIIYGQSAADGDLGGIFAGGAKPLYTTHPTPRIPAAVLAARQRAAHIQSALQAQSQAGQGALPERLTTERVYVKQPARPSPTFGHRHEPAPIVYETSTEPSSEHSYVTDGPSSVVQIPAANRVLAANEHDPHVDERRPIFRPRPIEFRPRDDTSSPAPGRFRTPYGLPPPYARSFTPLPPPQESPYGGRVAPIPDVDDKDREVDEPQQQQQHLNSIAPYRQHRRLHPAADSGYQQPQQQLQQQAPQQQQQNSFPIPVPYSPGQYPGHLGGGGRLPSSPYYYDIPAERPLTARDFERILQLLIFRHQQQQVAQQVSRYRLGGGYNDGFNGGYGYNPYFPGPSPPPFGLGGPYIGGGYPQQQIPRPPLPFPYPGGPYDGQGYQNPLYSPSAPSANVRGGPQGGQTESDGGYGTALPAAARRNGQYYQPPLDVGSSSAAGTGSLRSSDYLPPDVRESLLYRMLMLAIQAPGSGEVLPLAAPTGPSNGQLPLHHLQGASSMPRPQTQPNHRDQSASRPEGPGAVTATSAAATMLPMYSKKPVRSVQILGEE